MASAASSAMVVWPVVNANGCKLHALETLSDKEQVAKLCRAAFDWRPKRLVRSWRRQIFRTQIFTPKECTSRSVKTGGA
ncbi:hypothetical protein ACLB1N_04835 [Escherichia coli]